jgi:hypothetical protein
MRLMSEEQTGVGEETAHRPDHGLKRLLTYTFIALVLAVLASLVAVNLVIRWFDKG